MKLTHHHATILFWIGLLLLTGFSAFAYKYYFVGEKQEQIFCTMEAMQCPDGVTYVGREGPNCEFKKCPEFNSGSDFKTSGTVFGKVSIGPLCPVEPCNSTVNPYSGKELIFKSGTLTQKAKLGADGSYQLNLLAGNYSITLSDCQYMGCSVVFPKNINVTANKNFELNIDIDTGIR